MLSKGKSAEVEEENNTANALGLRMCQVPRLISSTDSLAKEDLDKKGDFSIPVVWIL
ncbi:hypothetical protein QQP08_020642 [Theobroma cacao]|nr:hypothetical protein QQP08_020642 [Theobroma cacao]